MTVLALILLVVVAALVAMFVQFIARENKLDSVRVVGDSQGSLTSGQGNFLETFQLLTNTTIYEGNRVELLLNGEGTFPRLLEDLRSARSLITWHVFWFRKGELADQIGAALIDRARNGVPVFFLIDDFGSNVGAQYLQKLKEAGVEVQHFRRLRWSNAYKVQQRMHIRAVVIDGRIGYTGGFAIDDRWKGSGRAPDQWRDTNVRLSGPAVDQLQAAFVANWAESTRNLLVGKALFHAQDERRGDVRCGLLHTAPSLGSTNAERYFILSIAAAHRRLYITNPYFIPDRDFRRMLREAVARGVDVRVLTPGSNTDKKSVLYASHHHYEELLEGGVRIWEYQPTMVHAKTLVCDGVWFSVGTINFDNRSITLNDEVTLAGQDESMSSQLEEVFREDCRLAKEINLHEFRERPRWERIKEWMWSRVELLL